MKIRLVVLSFLLLICCLVPLAQQQQRGRIEGVVVRAGTSEPVVGARVIVSRVNVATGANLPPAGAATMVTMTSAGNALPPPPPPTIAAPGAGTLLPVAPPPPPALPIVTTDRQGRFSIPDLDDGTYRLLVISAGYVRQEFGQRVFPGQGTPLTLSAGQILQDLRITLAPVGNLSGRVVDDSGQPAIGMPLMLLKSAYNQFGQRTFQSSGTGNTNDRGEYRMFFLTPGRYFLAGGNQPGPIVSSTVPRTLMGPNDPGENYAFTYYPGVANLDQAAAIDIRSGAEVAIDFSVARQQLYNVKGRVIDAATNRPPPAVNVSISYQTITGQSGMSTVGPLYDSATGSFEARNLLPGSYLLQISSQSGTARALIEVANRDLETPPVVIKNGPSIPGVVRVESGALPGVFQRLQLRPVVGGTVWLMGAAPGGPVAADGTFKLDNVPPGEYRVTIPSMPDYYVKQISFDRNDALNSPFVVPEASTQTGALEIVLSSKVGQIEGVVTDERGQAVTGIQAVLVPDSNRDRTDLFKAITTDQTGRFVMKGIPPGDYKLYAWDALENYGYFDPDLLKRSEPLGKGIRVNESDNRIVDLKMIPAGETP